MNLIYYYTKVTVNMCVVGKTGLAAHTEGVQLWQACVDIISTYLCACELNIGPSN